MRLMLLDTASLYFRAFFGMPDSLRAPDGTPVNAVRGLVDFISRLITEYQPSHLVCCWDNHWRPSWRVELVPSYKQHRVVTDADGVSAEDVPAELAAQIPIIADVLTAMGIAVCGVDDHEADDVIGTLATQAQMPVEVVTGDRDLFQLVDDGANIRVLYTARGVGNHEQITESVVQEKYHIRADQYADYATLRGDASDGLPGVAGVGDKTAVRLLTTWGDIRGVQAAAADAASTMTPRVRSQLLAAADYLAAAEPVVAVARQLPIEASWDELRCPGQFADAARMDALTQQWGLGRSTDRMHEALTSIEYQRGH